MIGTPLITFSRIMAASDESQVFNGMCGAESDWVRLYHCSRPPDSRGGIQRRSKDHGPPILSHQWLEVNNDLVSLLALGLNTTSAETKSPIVQAVEAEMARG